MGIYTGVGYIGLAVSSAAVALGTLPSGADRAVVIVEGGPVRWRDDGTMPTASVGMPLKDGDGMNFDGDLTALRFIRSGATDAVVHISYYR
jgi:hypothetical protein